MKNPFRKRYRIVTDRYLGYEVQAWRWWLPVWIQVGLSNTHSTAEEAEIYMKRKSEARKVIKEY